MGPRTSTTNILIRSVRGHDLYTIKDCPRTEASPRTEKVNPYSVGNDFSRQNLTSVDIRF